MSGLLIGKLVGQLLLPPGCFIVLASIGFLARARWWGRMLLVASLAALWLLSTGPVRDALTRPLEYAAPPLSEAAIGALHDASVPTAIVLLGGGTREKAPEYAGVDDLSRFAMMRTIYAAWLARQTGLPVYATGGRPLSKANESEGGIMRRMLLRFGVADAMAFAEESSENTWQNAMFMQRILQQSGVSRVVLVTSAWHMPRALWCFRQQGLDVIAAPMDYLTSTKPYDMRGLIPDAVRLLDSSLALHEYIGLAWYRLRFGHEWTLHLPWQ